MNAASGAGRPRRTLAALATQFGLHPTGTDDLDAVVTGVSLDNRLTAPGEVFAALPGAKTHGARFAAQAAAGGAVGVLTDAAGADLLTQEPAGVPVLVAPDPRAVLGEVASWVYGHPSHRLGTYAVTGTNGKTTTSYFLEHILAAIGRGTGLIGTVEFKIGAQRTPARLTTPEAPALHGLLDRMAQAGVDDLVMEVSSHALDLHRVDGVTYDVAGFTNLTQDHLDFHHDMDGYYRAKAALFTPQRARRGVVMVDDAWGRRLAEDAGIEMVTVSVTGAEAHWQARAASPRPQGTPITLTGPDRQHLEITVGLPGEFNVANAALALVMAITGGATGEQITAALPRGLDTVVPGRMEVLGTAPRVLVDFAHNTEAIEQALTAVRAQAEGRVFVIFGATGDRDRTKRAAMGAVAVQGADVVVITDDDPHDEDPAAIRAEVMAGAREALPAEARRGRQVDLHEVAPRQAAIARVVRFAAEADTVLVAGRGHETWQEIAGVDHHLDDRQEVRNAMADREQHPQPPGVA